MVTMKAPINQLDGCVTDGDGDGDDARLTGAGFDAKAGMADGIVGPMLDGGIKRHHRHQQARTARLAVDSARIIDAVADVFSGLVPIGTGPNVRRWPSPLRIAKALYSPSLASVPQMLHSLLRATWGAQLASASIAASSRDPNGPLPAGT